MKSLTSTEQKQLINTIKRTKDSERDLVIIELLLNTGLRASELAGLAVGDVRGKLRLFVRPELAKRKQRKTPDGKPRVNSRTVSLNVRIQDILHMWLAHKMANLHESIEDSAPLFVTRLGGQLTKRSLQLIVEKWMVRSGLTTMKDGEVKALFSTHSLRHTYAQKAADRNGTMKQMKALQKSLGHATIATVGVYFDAREQDMDDLAESVSMSPTRAKRLADGL